METQKINNVSRETKKLENMNKQQWLDKTPEGNEEIALQNLLHVFSKTKLESFRRMFNEISTLALYKTQLRAISFGDIHNAINKCVSLNQEEKQNE